MEASSGRIEQVMTCHRLPQKHKAITYRHPWVLPSLCNSLLVGPHGQWTDLRKFMSHDPIIRLLLPSFHPLRNHRPLNLPLRPDMNRLVQIHFLIQRPRFNTNPLRCLWVIMEDADAASCAEIATTDATRVALALEITNILLGRGWKVKA